MFEITLDAGRTIDYTVTLTEADGSTAVLVAAGDVVRCKVSRGGGTPVLDIDSADRLAGDSFVTVSVGSNSATIRFGQADTIDLCGAYSIEVALVDDSDTDPADPIKSFEKGVVHFVPSAGGDIAKT